MRNVNFFLRKNIFAFDELDKYRRKTLDPSFKGAVFDYLLEVLLINMQNRDKLKICKQHLLPVQSTFYTRQNFYLLEKINTFLGNSKSNGLIQHLMSNNLNLQQNIDSKVESSGQSSLTLQHLRGQFDFLLIYLLVAFVVFVLEILVKFVKKYKIR